MRDCTVVRAIIHLRILFQVKQDNGCMIVVPREFDPTLKMSQDGV